MKVSRRHFVVLSAGVVTSRLFDQGVTPRSVKPEAKPAHSGRAFDAHFTDVAREAGLAAPVIYGNPDFKDYILEAVGCGCTFIDYDNDGWLDAGFGDAESAAALVEYPTAAFIRPWERCAPRWSRRGLRH
jgi:hypothetical protein